MTIKPGLVIADARLAIRYDGFACFNGTPTPHVHWCVARVDDREAMLVPALPDGLTDRDVVQVGTVNGHKHFVVYNWPLRCVVDEINPLGYRLPSDELLPVSLSRLLELAPKFCAAGDLVPAPGDGHWIGVRFVRDCLCDHWVGGSKGRSELMILDVLQLLDSHVPSDCALDNEVDVISRWLQDMIRQHGLVFPVRLLLM